MAVSNHSQELHVGKFEASSKLKLMSYVFIAIGLITFALGLMKNQERVWAAYLVSFFFFSCVGLGGLFWTSLQNLVKAGWSVSIRRYAEGLTAYLPVMVVTSLILVLGLKYLYPWADHEKVAESALLQNKATFLNTTFLIIRLLVFGLGMLAFRQVIVGNSLKQDKTGDEQLSHKNVGYSIGFVLFFAITFSLFSVDMLMSLLPTWYSTIFGIYCFSGLFQALFAVLIPIVIFMRRAGFVKGYVTEEHLHDLAKFMKGFTVFWAYIAFSQFMLIWYANIPEETEYYIMRAQNGWMAISFALLIFRFIVPFLALLPKGLKRNENHLLVVSGLILVMQYVDIYWMVYPNFFDGKLTFGFMEIGMFLGFAGLFLMVLFRFLSKNNLVALKDPRLKEAITHHVTY
ncbi:MAG: molybdopterin oxidoreductase [Pseudobdellovibrionaceae bacterium]